MKNFKKVMVNGKKGYTSCVIPHSNGTYPVWGINKKQYPEFVLAKDVTFIK